MSDQVYLYDILSAARKAQKFIADLSRDEFEQSELHQAAVVKQIEIIGEASQKISPTLRNQHPEVPWPQMIGMRHRLIHDYQRIDSLVVWETVKDDAPELERLIRTILDSFD